MGGWENKRMKINIKKCLELFDERHLEHRGHANSIIAMLGEDLAASAFKAYIPSVIGCEERKFQAEGFKNGSGPQLDRWFYNGHKNILYQCEIKSWSAWATTGRELKIDASLKEARKISDYYWQKPIAVEFRGKGKKDKTSKVLVKMQMKNRNNKYKNATIEPLLIFWWPVSKEKNLSPFFSVDVSDLKIGFKSQFKKLHIFSVSLYLRKLDKSGEKWFTVKEPDFDQRIVILKGLLG